MRKNRFNTVLALSFAGILLLHVFLFLAKGFWMFELLTHYVIYYAVLLGVLAVLFFVRRMWVLAAVVLMLFLFQGVQIWPYLPVNETREDYELTVLSHNFYRNNDNFEALKEMIELEDPDVFLIMEMSDEIAKELESYSVDYPYFYISEERGSFGMAMLSKYPAEFESIYFEELISIDAKISLQNKELRVIGFHPYPPVNLDTAKSRNNDIQELAEYVDGQNPLIVMGDFNMSSWSPYFKDLISGTGLEEARVGFGINPTWSAMSWWLNIPIDHILVSDDFVVDSFYVSTKTGSDHLPVVARLSWGEDE